MKYLGFMLLHRKKSGKGVRCVLQLEDSIRRGETRRTVPRRGGGVERASQLIPGVENFSHTQGQRITLTISRSLFKISERVLICERELQSSLDSCVIMNIMTFWVAIL